MDFERIMMVYFGRLMEMRMTACAAAAAAAATTAAAVNHPSKPPITFNVRDILDLQDPPTKSGKLLQVVASILIIPVL